MKFVILSLLGAAVAAASAPTSAETLEPTHRQADVLKPTRGGSALTLHSFVLDRDGNIVAAVSSGSTSRRSPSGASNASTARGWIQVYSPDKQLLREVPLSFAPSAVALTPDGHYLAAGEGRLCACDENGKVLAQSTLAALLQLDEAKLKEEIVADYKRDQEEYASNREAQTKTMRDLLARLESKPADQRSNREGKRIESLKSMIESQSRVSAEPPPGYIDQLVEQRLRIPSLSLLPDGVLVTMYRNRGYEVWRTSMQFDNPRRLIGDLRGCCGQMDVISAGNRIMTAENTNFRVGIYDLDGASLSGFGERYKEGNNGFGSCCNPMNVHCCSNGDIITAESSIGHIKRFSADGKLLAVIGRARIGGGCKHVAIGFDEKRDRYYVQYQDRDHICILLPNDEAAPLVAAQDRKLKLADAATLKLEGKWVATTPASADSRGDWEDLFYDLYGYVQEPCFDSITFKPDHSVSLGFAPRGGSRGDKGFRRWYAADGDGRRIDLEFEREDGYVDFTLVVSVKDENHIELKQRHETRIYERQN